jgi:hypothetical protein
VRVTHPFHPLSGKQFVCVGQRHSRYGSWLLLDVGGDELRAVPPQWTDFAVPDPERVLGQGRSYFRVSDLVQLADLVDRLRSRCAADTR